MELHLTYEDRSVGWRIPVYDKGEFIGYVSLALYEDWRTGIRATADFKEDMNNE